MCHLSGVDTQDLVRSCGSEPRWILRLSEPGWEKAQLPLSLIAVWGYGGVQPLPPFDKVTSSGPAQLCERQILGKPQS